MEIKDTEKGKTTSVSAVITTFNRPETLERAMKSVVAQTILPYELVVIDNGGQSETNEVVMHFSATSPIPVRFIREHTRGVSAARNRGIKEVATDYLAFLDDDDTWATGHISLFLGFVSKSPSLALYAGWTSRFSDTLHRPDFVKSELLQEYRRDIVDGFLIRRKKELSAPFYTPHMSASIVNTAYARQRLFDQELQGREEICFVWLLGELGDLVIHDYSHAYVDQLDASLFSLPLSASRTERLDLDIKKSYWGVKMLEKIRNRMDVRFCPSMESALRSAYFDHAYANLNARDIRSALTFGIKSARLGLQVRHIKLLIRILVAVAMPPITMN